MKPTTADKLMSFIFAFIMYVSTLLFLINVISKLEADMFYAIIMTIGAGIASFIVGVSSYHYLINSIKG